MQHNQEMLEKNGEKWGDKVRIIGLSVDDSLDDLKKRIQEKKWEKVEHFKIQKGWDKNHDAIKYF